MRFRGHEKYNHLTQQAFITSLMDRDPSYVEVEDTGAADSLNTVRHGLGRIPVGVKVVNIELQSAPTQTVPEHTIPAQTDTSIPVGSLAMWGTGTPPTDWLDCDGSAVSRTTYAELFAVIGTTFGVGDGSTTFNLPNFKGRSPLGVGQGSTAEGGGAGTSRTLAATGGEETHTLVLSETPAHRHEPSDTSYSFVVAKAYAGGDYDTGSGTTKPTLKSYTDYQGGDGDHENMHPFLVTHFIIKAKSITLSSTVVSAVTLNTAGLQFYRLAADPEWTEQDIALRFTLANARLMLEVF